MTRYDRQMQVIGDTAQARLRGGRVTVIGAGGLAATLLPLLAGAGVGRLTIWDPDFIEVTNLHRQTLFSTEDIGLSKAQVAARRLVALNPDVEVYAVVAGFSPEHGEQILARSDVVIDAADSFAVTYALSDLCYAAGVPLISASVTGTSGYAGGFCGGGPSYRAVFPELPQQMTSCAAAGVMGPVVAALGALQAQMCLSTLTGADPSPVGQMLRIDGQTWRTAGMRFDGAPEPDHHPKVIGLAQITQTDLVIDLRTVEEAAKTHPRARRLCAAQAIEAARGSDRRCVLICTSGLRAWRIARQIDMPEIAIATAPKWA